MFSKNKQNVGWMSKKWQTGVQRGSVSRNHPGGFHSQTRKGSINAKSIEVIQEELLVAKPNGSGATKPLLSVPESLQAIVAAIPVPLVVSRYVDGTILYANGQFCQKFNRSSHHLVGTQLARIYHHAHRDREWQTVLAQTGEVNDYEVEVKPIDGGVPVWVTMSARVLNFEGSQFILTTFNPIAIEPELDKTLQALVADTAWKIGEAFFSQCASHLTRALNVRYVVIVELVGNPCDRVQVLAFSEDAQLDSNATYAIANTPYELTIEEGEYICTEGLTTKFPDLKNSPPFQGSCSYHGLGLFDSTGEPIGAICILHDRPLALKPQTRSILKILAARAATELDRKQVAKARMENETRLNLALKAAHMGVWDWQLSTGIITWSKEMAAMLGFGLNLSQGPAEIYLQTIHPDDRDRVEQAIARAINQCTEYHTEYRIIHRQTGQIRWIASDANIVCELNNQAVRITGTICDISERKKTELALVQSEANLRAIFNSSIEAIVLIDQQYKIQGFNKPAQKIAQVLWKQEIHPGTSIVHYFGNNDLAAQVLNLSSVFAGQKTEFEWNVTANTRDEYWFQINCHPVFNDSNETIAACVSVLNITERKKAVGELVASEERFRSLVQNSTDIITILEPNGTIRYESPSIERILGYDPETLLGKNAFDYVHPEERSRIKQIFARSLKTPGSVVEIQFRFRHANGHWVYLESIGTNWQKDPKIRGFVVNSRDITDRQQQEERLQLLERAIAASKNGVTITDVRQDNQLVYVNPAFEQITGYSASEAIGTNCRFLLGSDREQSELQKLRSAIRSGKPCSVVLRNYRKNGSVFWNELHISPVYNAYNQLTHFIGIQNDISDRKAVEEQLIHQAYHDPLTGLANRSLLMERLQEADETAQQESNYQFAVLFLDLDRFKVVNDSLGHAVGDMLLIVISLRLQSCLQPCDTLARIGGDHFVMLLQDIKNTDRAIDVAEQIHQQLQEPFTLKGHEFFISGSIGIAVSSMGYERPADLLRDADIAMYRAKQNGKAQHAVFDKLMHDRLVARLQLENELRHTIEEMQNGQSQALWLAYQPIVCLDTGKIKGFEALVRWDHPERGFISPTEFIPIAEESGLIIPLGVWIMREACHQLHEWQSEADRDYPNVSGQLTVSVNLSGKQFLQIDLIHAIDQILQETHLSPNSLKLEITETAIVENMEYALKTLTELRKRNILLSLDDFGTGYSSLSYLHYFPLDTLKIDRSFVSCINQDSKHRKIIKAIVTLAHALGMDVTAEGLETSEQFEQLKLLECELGQGYFFSKPLDRIAAYRLMCQSDRW